MATLTEIYNLHGNTELKAKVTAAVAKASVDVINEPVNTANHAARLVWAKDAFLNAGDAAERMMWAVVGNTTIQNSSPNFIDDDIQFVVNSNINLFI